MEIIGYHDPTPRRITRTESSFIYVSKLFPDSANVKINYQELGKKLETTRKSKN